jgi:hypothetical protein
MENIENRDESIVRREIHCSFCGELGHNRVTCNNQRLLNFEIACSTECQTLQENEFKDWLLETYHNNIILLKKFVYKKLRIQTSRIQNILFYINEITRYIYETYKYQHQHNLSETDTDSDYESLPDLISVENEYNDISIIDNFIRDYNTNAYINYYSSNMDLNLENIFDYVNQQTKEKKFAIESVMETLENDIAEQTYECCICFESYNKSNFIKLGCQHEFCNNCVQKSLYIDKRPNPCCAYCRKVVTKMICRTNIIHDKMSEFIL